MGKKSDYKDSDPGPAEMLYKPSSCLLVEGQMDGRQLWEYALMVNINARIQWGRFSASQAVPKLHKIDPLFHPLIHFSICSISLSGTLCGAQKYIYYRVTGEGEKGRDPDG